ncbi:hypothetical protein [Flavobacterium sp. 102]|uniref:hypothetical protein n=1 Tax=Flavobacterium sp. 102 TaxID=2135623 RepID=UPI000EAF1AC1|nr:hypothetical protein [Flavobacterium sp. 102]RKS01307.1 hypothetical protein C8C84_0957 [Flavobacterium sp. 102]
MKQKITLFFALIFVNFFGQAQTTLTAGDIAIVLINATDNTVNTSTANDNISFVLLKDIASGTLQILNNNYSL